MSKHEAPEDGKSGLDPTLDRPSPRLQPQPQPTPQPQSQSLPMPQRPSPTSRARRAAVDAGLDPALHRPSPRPRPQPRPLPQPHTEAQSVTQTQRGSLAVDDRLTADASAATTAIAGHPGPDNAIPAPITAAPITTAPSSARRVSRTLVAVLLVLIVGLGATAWWLENSRGPSGSSTERDQALSTAKSAASVIFSYNYRQLDKDIAAGKARLTGRASTDYVEAMTKTIKPAAAKTRAVVQAQIDGAGVESASAGGKQVTVLVFGEQKVTNTSLSQPRTDLFRLRLTLSLVGKRWLVSKLDQI